MEINLNIKLSHQKDHDYNINVDIDPERIEPNQTQSDGIRPNVKTELGGIQRPDADRLKILKSPALRAEDEATAAVMDELELE
jgi:hypothetical protein